MPAEQATRPSVAVLGGANLDIVGRPVGALLAGESNPGAVTSSAGGVARNVAANLARLGVDVRLLSLVGQDGDGERILADCRECGVDVSGVGVADGATSRYLAILDRAGDLACAVSQMDLIESIDAEFIDARASEIAGSSLLVADTNLSHAAIGHLLESFTDTPCFVDTVSVAKAERLKGLIGRVHTLKPNRAEAEVLTGIVITDRGDLEQAVRAFIELGVRRVFISLGAEGLFFGDADGSGWVTAPRVRVVNATGAGDAAMAALAYAHLQEMDMAQSARFALAAAVLTLSHSGATHPGLARPAIETMIRRLEVR